MSNDQREAVARHLYETVIRDKEGHHCPPWEALSDLMREHLISLVPVVEEKTE